VGAVSAAAQKPVWTTPSVRTLALLCGYSYMVGICRPGFIVCPKSGGSKYLVRER
jgi:hypothetical protein